MAEKHIVYVRFIDPQGKEQIIGLHDQNGTSRGIPLEKAPESAAAIETAVGEVINLAGMNINGQYNNVARISMPNNGDIQIMHELDLGALTQAQIDDLRKQTRPAASDKANHKVESAHFADKLKDKTVFYAAAEGVNPEAVFLYHGRNVSVINIERIISNSLRGDDTPEKKANLFFRDALLHSHVDDFGIPGQSLRTENAKFAEDGDVFIEEATKERQYAPSIIASSAHNSIAIKRIFARENFTTAPNANQDAAKAHLVALGQAVQVVFGPHARLDKQAALQDLDKAERNFFPPAKFAPLPELKIDYKSMSPEAIVQAEIRHQERLNSQIEDSVLFARQKAYILNQRNPDPVVKSEEEAEMLYDILCDAFGKPSLVAAERNKELNRIRDQLLDELKRNPTGPIKYFDANFRLQEHSPPADVNVQTMTDEQLHHYWDTHFKDAKEAAESRLSRLIAIQHDPEKIHALVNDMNNASKPENYAPETYQKIQAALHIRAGQRDFEAAYDRYKYLSDPVIRNMLAEVKEEELGQVEDDIISFKENCQFLLDAQKTAAQNMSAEDYAKYVKKNMLNNDATAKMLFENGVLRDKDGKSPGRDIFNRLFKTSRYGVPNLRGLVANHRRFMDDFKKYKEDPILAIVYLIAMLLRFLIMLILVCATLGQVRGLRQSLFATFKSDLEGMTEDLLRELGSSKWGREEMAEAIKALTNGEGKVDLTTLIKECIEKHDHLKNPKTDEDMRERERALAAIGAIVAAAKINDREVVVPPGYNDVLEVGKEKAKDFREARDKRDGITTFLHGGEASQEATAGRLIAAMGEQPTTPSASTPETTKSRLPQGAVATLVSANAPPPPSPSPTTPGSDSNPPASGPATEDDDAEPDPSRTASTRRSSVYPPSGARGMGGAPPVDAIAEAMKSGKFPSMRTGGTNSAPDAPTPPVPRGRTPKV